MKIGLDKLAKMIDHTNLNPSLIKEDIIKLCNEAQDYNFGSVCLNPFWVSTANELLKGTDIGIVGVIGFPLGQNKTDTKVSEGKGAIADGATELDMVMNIGALKSQMFDYFDNDIEQVCSLGVPVKVIIETCYLLHEEKVMACELAKRSGASYIKTSTGFGSAGAKREDVELIRRVVGGEMGIKAAGGITTWDDARAMIEAGADRIGASRSIRIIEDFKNSQ